MPKLLGSMIALMLFVAFVGCGKKSASSVEETADLVESDTVDHGFELIDSKTEFTGNLRNRMDLYFPTRKVDQGHLEDLCKVNKRNIEVTGFYYLVVFDQKKNAVFPNNPLTAMYGIDEESQKHIIAVYTHNANNKYSKITTYAPNMWEGKPWTYEIY